jgi:hypothetical protein
VVPAEDGGPIEVIQRKSKDAELADPIPGTLEPVEIAGWFDEDGEQVTSAVFIEGEFVKPQESSKLGEHKKMFDNAWWETGAEIIDGRPYVAREKLLTELVKKGIKESYALNMLKPANTGRLIGALINSEQIAPESEGWRVVDNVWASSLLLRLKD